MKSKHYRKDVIMARVILGIFCIAVIVLLVVAGMKISEKLKGTEDTQKIDSESQLSEDSESEEIPETETEPGSEIIIGTEPEEPEEVYGKITASSLNLRTEPSTSSEVITSIKKDSMVQILETWTDQAGTWYKVSFDGKEGYVSGKYVEIIENATDDADVTIE